MRAIATKKMSKSELDLACRRALTEFRLEAFDNTDVDALLVQRSLSVESVAWIGRHLMRGSRSAAAYAAGQRILNMLDVADVA